MLASRDELKQQYDLLYVFDVNNIGFTESGAQLVDEKILYSKPCENRKSYAEVLLYKALTPSDDLYRLALISGAYSRFKLDERFPKGSYERLYSRWIENSCPSHNTNKQIFIFNDEHDCIRGMITFDYHQDLGHIGLVAVDNDYQHQGIEEKLCQR